METLDEFDAQVVREFLVAHWAAFERHCKGYEIDPRALMNALGESEEVSHGEEG